VQRALPKPSRDREARGTDLSRGDGSRSSVLIRARSAFELGAQFGIDPARFGLLLGQCFGDRSQDRHARKFAAHSSPLSSFRQIIERRRLQQSSVN